MHRSILSLALLAGIPAVALVGCSTAPKSAAGQQDLQREADRRLQQALQLDPSLRPVLNNSAGYAVFPVVGEGGLIFGGGYGKGALYERGQFVGFVDITSVSGGLKIGGQQYSQMIVFETPGPLAAFKNGSFSLSADASAVALRSGVAGNTQFRDNVQVYIWDQAGLMADASIGAQTFRYTPSDDAAQAAGGWYQQDNMDHTQAQYESYEVDTDAQPAGERLNQNTEIQQQNRQMQQQQNREIQQQNRQLRQQQQNMHKDLQHDSSVQSGEIRSETRIESEARPAASGGKGPLTSDVDIRDNYRTTPDGNLNRGNTVETKKEVKVQSQRDPKIDVDVNADPNEVDVDVNTNR